MEQLQDIQEFIVFEPQAGESQEVTTYNCNVRPEILLKVGTLHNVKDDTIMDDADKENIPTSRPIAIADHTCCENIESKALKRRKTVLEEIREQRKVYQKQKIKFLTSYDQKMQQFLDLEKARLEVEKEKVAIEKAKLEMEKNKLEALNCNCKK